MVQRSVRPAADHGLDRGCFGNFADGVLAMSDKRPGKRYSALIEFKGEARIVDDIRARDVAHAWQLVARRKKTFFRQFQIPNFQQRSYRVIGLFYGSIKLATE